MKNYAILLIVCFLICSIQTGIKAAAEPVCNGSEQLNQCSEATPLGAFVRLPQDSINQIANYLPYRSLALLGKASSAFYSIALSINNPFHLWTTKKVRSKLLRVNGDPAIRSLSFSRDGTILAAGCDDKDIRTFDMKTGQERVVHTDIEKPKIAFSTIDNDVLMLLSEKDYKLESLVIDDKPRLISSIFCALFAGVPMAFYNRLFALRLIRTDIELCAINADKTVKRLKAIPLFLESNGIVTITFVSDNKLLLVCNEVGSLHFEHFDIHEINIESGKISKTIPINIQCDKHPEQYVVPCLSPDGTMVAFEQLRADSTEKLIIWDLINNRKIVELILPAGDREFEKFTFSPDSKIIAVQLLNNIVALVNASTGEIVQELCAPPVAENAEVLAFSQRGDMLAAGYENGMIVLWRAGADS